MSHNPFSTDYRPRIVTDNASARSRTSSRSRDERMASGDADAKWYATGTVGGLGPLRNRDAAHRDAVGSDVAAGRGRAVISNQFILPLAGVFVRANYGERQALRATA